MLSCKMDNSKFIMIESKGLDIDNLRLNTSMFYSRDTAFIAGSSDIVTHNPDFPKKDSNQFAFLKSTALLFKTVDGCRTWVKKAFGDGHFYNILKIRDVIFAFKKSDKDSGVHIYSSSNLGITWGELSFPKGTYNLISVGSQLCAIGTDSSKTVPYIYFSENNGESWSKRNVLSYYPFDNPVDYKGKMLYLTNSKPGTYFPDKIVVYDVKSNSDSVIELPKELSCYFLTNNNGEIRLTGIRDGFISVYSLLENNNIKYEYSYLKEASYFPQSYYKSNNDEFIVVGKRDSSDVANRILKTTDNGKDWDVINFEEDKYIKPFYFLNDNGKTNAYFFAGSGKFQIMQ
jgi:hypothetical protein